MSKPYTLVSAENALNAMIDQAKTPGNDFWAIEQQKRTFMTSIQEVIAQEVAIQTRKVTQEIQASQQSTQSSYHLQNSTISYEKIERYNTRHNNEPGFETFIRNIASIPKILAFSAFIVLGFYGFINLFVRI